MSSAPKELEAEAQQHYAFLGPDSSVQFLPLPDSFAYTLFKSFIVSPSRLAYAIGDHSNLEASWIYIGMKLHINSQAAQSLVEVYYASELYHLFLFNPGSRFLFLIMRH
jgi:hypothetical protein